MDPLSKAARGWHPDGYCEVRSAELADDLLIQFEALFGSGQGHSRKTRRGAAWPLPVLASIQLLAANAQQQAATSVQSGPYVDLPELSEREALQERLGRTVRRPGPTGNASQH